MRSWDATGVRGRFEKGGVQCGCFVCMRQKPRLLTGKAYGRWDGPFTRVQAPSTSDPQDRKPKLVVLP